MKNTEKYQIGTVLWRMSGDYHEGKCYWSPKACSIERHCKNGFGFSALPFDSGNSWGNIGKNYFLSREDCLARWGDRPMIEDDNRPLEKQESPDPKEYDDVIIQRDDSVNNVRISVGGGDYQLDTLKWDFDSELEEYTEDGDYLTLGEIREQIWAGNPHKPIIEVRVEGALKGIIYQVGNYKDDLWHVHGTTRGYA